MPRAPLRPCRHPGCPELTDRGYCLPHRHTNYQQDGQRRGSAARRGYDRHHQRWRALVLARDPLCRACLAVGLSTPSDTADHRIPLERGGTWAIENGQGLCTPCHNRKRGLEGHGWLVDTVAGRGLVPRKTGEGAP
jgi:5-methylcytosine-specific restriction protein A